MKLYVSTSTMPIGNWIRLFDEGDYSSMIAEGELDENRQGELLENWYRLNDEFMRKHLESSDFLDEIEETREIALMMCDYLRTLDRYTEFQFKLKIEQQNERKKNRIKSRIIDEKGYIERTLGYYLPMSASVDEYYAKRKQHNLIQRLNKNNAKSGKQ